MEFEPGGAVFRFAHINHRKLQRPADLLGGQADTLAGVHRCQHVRDELFDFRRDFFDAGALLPQHGMAVFDNV